MKKIGVGIQDFQKIIEEKYFYLDKTKAIYNIITSNSYYFLSRPRRFGKSLTLSTIKYLYLGKKELFKNTYIYDKWDFNQTNPIIYIDFVGYTADQNLKEYINRNLKIFIEDKIYYLKDFGGEYNIAIILDEIWEKTKKQTVIIVDEYDKAVLQNITNIKVAEEYRDFFASFYSGVKGQDDKIKLFMLTGLTKVLKMSVFSVLNNLQDLSFDPNSYDLMGYTGEEVIKNFSEEIDILAKKENLTREEIIEKIKINYNGYNFGNENDTIYNPRNINSLFLKNQFSYYWADTGIPSAILNYIDKNSIKVDEFITRLNESELRINELNFKLEDLTNIKAEVLFTNAGYLTISKYKNNVYTLGYPNEETEKVVNEFFIKLLKPKYDFTLMEKIADGLYEGIIKMDKELLEEVFEMMIYDFLNETAIPLSQPFPPREKGEKISEGWFKTFLGLFLRLNNIYYYPEVQNLKGRKDFVIPVNDKYYIIEAKVNKTTREAITQIDKKYIPQFKDGKEIIKVGLNWLREESKIEVEFEKNEEH